MKIDFKIDYEVRVLSQKCISQKLPKCEKSYHKKIYKYAHMANLKSVLLHLKKHKLTGCVIRSLPFRSKKIYFQETNFISSIPTSLQSLRFIKCIMCPDPKFVKITDFKRILNLNKNFKFFELNSIWHGRSPTDPIYSGYIKEVIKRKLNIICECDYSFRYSKSGVNELINFILKYKIKNLFVPHLGCGIFLFPQKIKKLHTKLWLITSASQSLWWIKIIKKLKSKNINLVFGTDFPFNGRSSSAINKAWNA